MPKTNVIKDEKLVNLFLEGAVDQVLPDKESLRKKLLSGDRVTAYMGFDPTGPYLHVGHAMGIRALRILQQLGHRVIFLVGDYTARVGDPDKLSTRELLTTEKIAENMSGWKDQAAQLIDFDNSDNPVEFRHNFEWLSKLELEDIIKLMSNMTVGQMLERDLFRKRIDPDNPIFLQELIYPLMQGYDSVAMNVDLELGGTDQIFNMMVGRDLVKRYLNKDKWVRANVMMPAPDGITMSKTKGNGINLSDSAENMYGVAMSYSDDQIITGLKLLTDMPDSEIKEIENAIDSGENPMNYKKLMAFKIVEIIKGEKDAREAQSHFENTIQGSSVSEKRTRISLQKLDSSLTIKNKSGDPVTIVSELISSSKGQAKILLQQNGVEINQKKFKYSGSEKLELQVNDIIKIGKRNWFEIVD